MVIITLSASLTLATHLVTLALVLMGTASDFIDGYLARRWKVTSTVGYVLDALGDRALHLALLLVMLERYDVNILIGWLLIFRDMAIYGVRLLSRDWALGTRELRWMSLIHATMTRIWLVSFLVRDSSVVFTGHDRLAATLYPTAQYALITVAIAFSYVGLFKSFRWTINQEHRKLL